MAVLCVVWTSLGIALGGMGLVTFSFLWSLVWWSGVGVVDSSFSLYFWELCLKRTCRGALSRLAMGLPFLSLPIVSRVHRYKGDSCLVLCRSLSLTHPPPDPRRFSGDGQSLHDVNILPFSSLLWSFSLHWGSTKSGTPKTFPPRTSLRAAVLHTGHSLGTHREYVLNTHTFIGGTVTT